MSEAKQTTDHKTIRDWVEARDGRPARVTDTKKWDDMGVLRIEFEDPGEDLEIIGWDAFFETFENENLAFLYQEKTADGSLSRFSKFVNRTA